LVNIAPGTVLNKTPVNRNFLSPVPYQFIIKRAPNLNYFVQKINFPGITSMPALQRTMFTDIPLSGVKLTWNPLYVTFKVDEELLNWLEIFRWLTAINDAFDLNQYGQLEKPPAFLGYGVTSELVLVVHDNEKNPNYNIYFHDGFPVSISDVFFESTPTDVNFITASATFRYSTYSIEKII
jgi:hypothetical protein